ncbi:hypothetical protein AGMMS49587_04870 [Spirochaetia bacterium]|nr:hypothetical protein AGMMS49587_04870 [Spirochaetia bacterium]
MNTTLLTTIKQLIAQQGESILSDSKKVNSLLSTMAANEPKPQRMAFVKCLMYGFQTELKNTQVPDRAACKDRLAHKLRDEEDMDLVLANDTLDLLEAVLFGTVPSAPEPAQQPVPIPPTPKPAAPPRPAPIPPAPAPRPVPVPPTPTPAPVSPPVANPPIGKKNSLKKPVLILCIIFGILALLIVAGIIIVPSLKHDAIVQESNPIIQISNNNSTVSNYQVAFEPIVEFHGEAYPANILATANMTAAFDGSPRIQKDGNYIGDVIGDFGVSVTLSGSSNETIPLRIEVESNKFIKKSIQEASIPTNTKIEIFPPISYDYSALEHLVQPTYDNVTFRIFINNSLVEQKVKTVRFHSVNEVPFVERSRFGNVVDRYWLFAAYVNEDDPLIDTILKEALDAGTINQLGLGDLFSFSGYQDIDHDGETSLEVGLQVLAVWNVFQRHKIKYSSITTTSTMDQNIHSQYVRTLKESFGNTQANCVDGTVLFASVLRKLGIEPFLVIIPGHMFLGYFLDNKMETPDFLETTMLGNEDLRKYTRDDSPLGRLKKWTGVGKTQSSASLDSFVAATTAGEEEFEAAATQLFDNSNNQYQIINIAYYRSLGVMPITRH